MSDTPALRVHPVPGHGAEDVVVDHEGRVLTGTEDGSIFAMDPGGDRVERVARTRGRPLGLELLPEGRLLVCDARRGLLAVDPAAGPGVEPEELTTLVEGRPMKFCNNAAVHGSGAIYFSDSSLRYGIDQWRSDMAENTATGRLLRRDPDGGVEVLLTGLRFANGVALAADESYVAVAQTGGRSVVRRWLTGSRAGTDDVLVDDLPGYPDNIARGSDGLIWVALAGPVDPVLERLMGGPDRLGRLASRLPQRMQPQPKRSVRVMAFDDRGAVVHDVSLAADGFHMVTGVREHDGTVWLGSLHESAVASFALSSRSSTQA